MRIAFDVSPLSHPLLGIGNYVQGSLGGLVEVAGGAHEIVAFAPTSIRGSDRIRAASRRRSMSSSAPTATAVIPGFSARWWRRTLLFLRASTGGAECVAYLFWRECREHLRSIHLRVAAGDGCRRSTLIRALARYSLRGREENKRGTRRRVKIRAIGFGARRKTPSAGMRRHLLGSVSSASPVACPCRAWIRRSPHHESALPPFAGLHRSYTQRIIFIVGQIPVVEERHDDAESVELCAYRRMDFPTRSNGRAFARRVR